MGLKDLLLQGPTANNQSLVGNTGTQFSAYSNTTFGVGGEPGPPNAVDTIAEASLTQDYNYTHGNSSATAVASQLDLNGQPGPQFDTYRNQQFGNLSEPNPNVVGDTVSEQGLTQPYNYTHGNSSATANATLLGLGGNKGSQFDNYRNQAYGNLSEPSPNVVGDTIAETSLTQDYNYTHGGVSATSNATLLGLGGNKGSQFANYRNKAYGNLTEPDPSGGPDNIVDTIAETSLTQDYNYTHGGLSATANATLLGLGGNKGQQFENYRNQAYGNLTEPDPTGGPDNIVDTIAEIGLTQDYNYTHGGMSATANATLLGLGGNKGSQFADYRNKAYGNALEPSPNVIGDTIAERSLTQPYNYTHGLSSATAGGPNGSMLDKNGLTPSLYKQLGPPDGRY
jgi:hypothetical protein